MTRIKEYISSPKYLKDMYNNPSLNGMFKTVDKVRIQKIKIDKSLFDFQNEVDIGEIDYMVKHFHRGAWYPVMLNQNFYLIDGQHRIAAAKKLGLKYIDVTIQTDDFRIPKKNKVLSK
jgi:uncharacterized protein (DUF1015 family)